MRWLELIEGLDGKLSHARLWPNIASAVATIVFTYRGLTGALLPEEWLIYLGCVGSYSAVIQGIEAAKQNQQNKSCRTAKQINSEASDD